MTKEKDNAIIIANANQFDKVVLKHNVLIAMTNDPDVFKAGREYSSWYVVADGDKFVTYFERREKPTKEQKPYWPAQILITKITTTVREAVDYLYKFGCEKFYLIKNYQSSHAMDYNTIITKI